MVVSEIKIKKVWLNGETLIIESTFKWLNERLFVSIYNFKDKGADFRHFRPMNRFARKRNINAMKYSGLEISLFYSPEVQEELKKHGYL